MKGLAVAALAVAIALPACAQRDGGHASFAGHSAPAVRSAPAFHGSFAPRPAFGYNPAPFTHAPVGYPSRSRTIAPPVRYPMAPPVHRPIFYQPNHGGPLHTTHRFFFHSYPYFSYLFYPSAIYVPSGDLFDDSFDDFDNPPQPPPDYSSNYPPGYNSYPPGDSSPYAQPAPEPDSSYGYPQPAPAAPYPYSAPGYPPSAPQPPSAPLPPSAPQPPPSTPEMQYVPGSADTVTLIFKDGRPPEQIQNYLATRTTLTILDNGHRREIALSDLDIPATMKANRQTGTDFELPTVVH